MSDFELDKNQDIQSALSQFEAKSSAMNPPQVPQSGAFMPAADTPKMVRLVIKFSGGAIKDERQAEYALLGFSILALLTTLALIYFSFRTPKAETAVQFREDITPEVRSKLPVGVYETLPSRYDNK